MAASCNDRNRAGAGGTIGTSVVAKAAPDGQPLLFTAASHTINGSLYAKLPYDPIRDFAGVAVVGTSGYMLIASSTVPARNVAELNALVKNPSIVERLARQGLEPLALSPEAFDQLLRSNFDKMAKVIAVSGAKVE
ncbi:MAG: tripartite tricarboxylate transporter substrate-binding protein [Betaproteobacteria bacterium]|nr:tripartite tricarboxylate transporter substrate-binding protein [Betaproteobacteria bacterium]